jgi:hypothetical protein
VEGLSKPVDDERQQVAGGRHSAKRREQQQSLEGSIGLRLMGRSLLGSHMTSIQPVASR